MSNGTQTFGNYLLQFSLAIDIVDNNTFNKFVGIIEDYVRNYLKIEHVSLKNKTFIDDLIGLQAVSGRDKGSSYTVRRDGEITGQTAYSFFNKVALWVVDKDKKDLRDPESQHVDLWNDAADLPQSREHKSPDIKTSIIVPIIREKEAVGVVEFETMKYIEPMISAKKELEKIADTISRVQYLHRTFEAQNLNTQTAIRSLQNYLTEAVWPELTEEPQIFVAFPMRAEDDVVGAMKAVLNSFSDRVRVVYWDQLNDTGKVDQQIIKAITNSIFGVCYLSEPNPKDSDHVYIDNANVVFEAGMFQSLTDSPREKPIGWIPIREDKSPPPPFDYASDRILIIERLNDSSLNRQAFSDNLKNSVEDLLGKIKS